MKGNLLAYFHAASIWGILWTVISEILINNIIFVIIALEWILYYLVKYLNFNIR